MNLIEELGIEKCQAIVSGVSDAHFFGCTIDTAIYWLNQSNEYHSTPMLFPNMSNQTAYVLDDLRTAIAEHEKCQHKWNETTSNGDAYRFFVCKHCDSTQNYVPFEADHCTDIRNHLSPNTKVIER